MNFKKKVNGSWVDTPHYIHNTSTATITTLPADIHPTGTTATVGLKGNTLQSSIPSPTSPVMPNGTGERTGNLYNINAHDVNNGYVNNAQLSQDGTTTTWGSAEISEYIPISGDTAYTFKGIGSYNSPCYGLYDENKQLIGAYRYNGAQIIKFTSPNNARYFRFTHIKTATRAMMVEGEYTSQTMPAYEPYGYKIPILSANITTPVYLGEVESTRLVKKLVFDGTENWQTATELGARIFYIPNSQIPDNKIVCTHYVVRGWNDAKNNDNSINVSFTYARQSINVHMDTYSTVSDFKTYLQQQYAAGHPVTIWYVLPTPQTVVVNEPLRKIGDYADEVSSITIPTIAGANTLSVDTTLQPSEVTVNYKGWHPVTDVHERDNGAWT